MHPASTIHHRWGLAGLPARFRPCSASAAEVHGQFTLHRVVPLISSDPHPRGAHVSDDRLASRMDVDVLDRDFLLAFAGGGGSELLPGGREFLRACFAWLRLSRLPSKVCSPNIARR